MLFKKKIKTDGVYIELEASKITQKIIKNFNDDLNNFLEDNFNKSINSKNSDSMKNTINDLHTTLIYSKKDFDGIIEIPFTKITSKIKGFKKFDNPKENIYALTLELDCEKCIELHNFLMKKYKFKYDFDEYIPHLTLSYKAKGITQKILDKTKEYFIDKLPVITFDKINIEPLDNDWDKDKD